MEKFYKNWKTYAIGLGIIVIGTGTGLGIYYGISTNTNATDKTITKDEIVKAVQGINYTIKANQGSRPESITNQINAQFIATKLKNEYKSAFNYQAFHFNKIIVNDHDLNVNDLKQLGIIEAKINYDYDAIKDNETTLTITVQEQEITSQDIVQAINETKNYTAITIINTEPENVINQINSKLIKDQLSDKYQKSFKPELFKLINITVNDHELNSNDLRKNGVVNAKINYDYDAIKDNETTLKITILSENESSTRSIVAINKSTYQIVTTVNSDVSSINNQINSEFIKVPLSDDIKPIFNNELFRFNKITVNNHDLNPDDLKQTGVINAKINYNYGQTSNLKTNLKITIANKTNSMTSLTSSEDETEVIVAINRTTYQITTNVNSDISRINNQITGAFIKEQLSDPEIKDKIKEDQFRFNKITVNNHDLNCDDLKETGVIDAKINYGYGQTSNLKTNLKITIDSNSEIKDEDIVQAINNSSYRILIETHTTADSLKSKINGDFIKKQLVGEIANAFDLNLFKLTNIFVRDNDGEHEVNDHDLNDITFFTNSKIVYDYGSIKGAEANNLMIVIQPSVEDIIGKINETTYQLSTTVGSQPANINNQITIDLIKDQLKDWNFGIFINPDLFKFNKIIVNDHELNADDLKQVGIIEAKINYDYDVIKGAETNLKIIINDANQIIINHSL